MSIKPQPDSDIISPVDKLSSAMDLEPTTLLSTNVDPESQTPSKNEPSGSSTIVLEDDDAGFNDNSNVPHLSIPALFWFFFYNFGLFAWGGPVAQIALIKERLVLQDKWITLARFQRVFAVYQILPGPEAVELCMFFGCLSAGRLGGIVAGIAFTLPGFVLMLLASYLYSLAGLDNKYFNASFRALQPIVAAMVVHNISSRSILTDQILDPTSNPQDCRSLSTKSPNEKDGPFLSHCSHLYSIKQCTSD
jgi:hypothetical protein